MNNSITKLKDTDWLVLVQFVKRKDSGSMGNIRSTCKGWKEMVDAHGGYELLKKKVLWGRLCEPFIVEIAKKSLGFSMFCGKFVEALRDRNGIIKYVEKGEEWLYHGGTPGECFIVWDQFFAGDFKEIKGSDVKKIITFGETIYNHYFYNGKLNIDQRIKGGDVIIPFVSKGLGVLRDLHVEKNPSLEFDKMISKMDLLCKDLKKEEEIFYKKIFIGIVLLAILIGYLLR